MSSFSRPLGGSHRGHLGRTPCPPSLTDELRPHTGVPEPHSNPSERSFSLRWVRWTIRHAEERASELQLPVTLVSRAQLREALRLPNSSPPPGPRREVPPVWADASLVLAGV